MSRFAILSLPLFKSNEPIQQDVNLLQNYIVDLCLFHLMDLSRSVTFDYSLICMHSFRKTLNVNWQINMNPTKAATDNHFITDCSGGYVNNIKWQQSQMSEIVFHNSQKLVWHLQISGFVQLRVYKNQQSCIQDQNEDTGTSNRHVCLKNDLNDHQKLFIQHEPGTFTSSSNHTGLIQHK